MGASLKKYDPSKGVLYVLGYLISGFAKDSYVTIERNEDAVTLTVGVQGEGAISVNRNRSGQMKIKLLASSPDNDRLSALAAAMEQGTGGVGAISFTDGSGTTRAQMAQAWVKKMPPAEFGKEVGEREWIFEGLFLDENVGGNLSA